MSANHQMDCCTVSVSMQLLMQLLLHLWCYLSTVLIKLTNQDIKLGVRSWRQTTVATPG
jgi:hypothetical protein